MKPILVVPYDENMTKEELLKAIADAAGSDVETVKKELCESKTKPQTDLLVKTPRKSRDSHEKNCETCRDKDAYDEWQGNCDECENGSMYTPQTEEEYINNLPWTEAGNGEQTDIEIARAIVHKAIDDAVIAEDAYPDLRQKMHDAVDNYEPQTEDPPMDEYYKDHDEFYEPRTERSSE